MNSLNMGRNLEDCYNTSGPMSLLENLVSVAMLDTNNCGYRALWDPTVCMMLRNYVYQSDLLCQYVTS